MHKPSVYDFHAVWFLMLLKTETFSLWIFGEIGSDLDIALISLSTPILGLQRLNVTPLIKVHRWCRASYRQPSHNIVEYLNFNACWYIMMQSL